MTEREWQLSRELAQTKMAMYEARSEALKLAHDIAKAEIATLGEKWIDPDIQSSEG